MSLGAVGVPSSQFAPLHFADESTRPFVTDCNTVAGVLGTGTLCDSDPVDQNIGQTRSRF